MNPANETITLPEIGELLALAAARDQRSTGTADNVAWWEDLNAARVTFKDAKLALTRYYAEVWPKQDPRQRFRATAPVIIEIAQGIRKKRHEEANFVYEPVDGETGAEYAARRQRQLRAIGDGQQPVYSMRELTRGPEESKQILDGMIAGVSQRMPLPPEIAQVLANARPAGLEVSCPRCHAEPNRKCTDPGTGRAMKRLHDSRVAAWAIVANPCPECRSAIGSACTELGEPYRDHAHKTRIDAARTAAAT